jgi:two-component system, NtrC family, C4-dicarboxylate transport sensor histidine kinase DctB
MTRRYRIFATIILVVVVIAAAGLSLLVRERALAELDKSSHEALGLLGDGLHTAIDRYEPVPTLIGDSAEIRALVESPAEPSRVDAANRFLEAKTGRVGAAYTYILNAEGQTIAASNWAASDSFVGNDYSIRPYYHDAKATCRGAYYGIGVTTRKPGYYLASCIRTGETLAGISVVKIDLHPFEESWQMAGEQVLVLDQDGIVFLATDPAWRYRPLYPRDPKRLQEIRDEKRYKDEPLDPPLIGENPKAIHPELQFTRPVAGTTWSIVLLASLAPVRRQTINTFVLALLSGLVIELVGMVVVMRGARLRAERSAKRELEQRVDERTSELRQARDALETEIAQRSHVDGELHRARWQLAQANRLAAIGQAFAGLAHEINQPLTALKTTLASSRILAARGQTQDLGTAIDDMALTVDRMAQLASDLKNQARPRERRKERVSLAREAGRAVGLLRFRAVDSGTTLTMEEHDTCMVLGDPVRLQQIAMNLVLNALEAVAGSERRVVHVTVGAVGALAELRVTDSGPGVNPEQQRHLFEPFFTTKAESDGLGLGLAISKTTVQEHGGTLTCAPNDGGGAVFVARIPLAEREAA